MFFQSLPVGKLRHTQQLYGEVWEYREVILSDGFLLV